MATEWDTRILDILNYRGREDGKTQFLTRGRKIRTEVKRVADKQTALLNKTC